MQYKIVFRHDAGFIFVECDTTLEELISLLNAGNRYIYTDDCFINIEEVAYIRQESQTVGTSDVITPPTPAELRKQHEDAQAHQPVRLDDQLSKL